MNQPGITSSDFVLSPNTSSLWTQFIKYFKRSGTFLPYLQTSAPLDYNKISSYYITRCDAEEIVAKTKFSKAHQGNRDRTFFSVDLPFEKYGDTQKRVIRVDFAPVPFPDSLDNRKAREDALFQNDVVLSKVIDSIPSPFVSIIYTSTSKGEVSYESSGPYKNFALIDDVLGFTNDPQNRDLWKPRDEHSKSQLNNHQKNGDSDKLLNGRKDTFARKRLPLVAERLAQEKLKKVEDMRKRKEHEKNTLLERIDEALTPESILICLAGTVLVFIIYTLFRLLSWIFFIISGEESSDSKEKGIVIPDSTPGKFTITDTQLNSDSSLKNSESEIRKRNPISNREKS